MEYVKLSVFGILTVDLLYQ